MYHLHLCRANDFYFFTITIRCYAIAVWVKYPSTGIVAERRNNLSGLVISFQYLSGWSQSIYYAFVKSKIHLRSMNTRGKSSFKRYLRVANRLSGNTQ